jgi:Uma2 family endonuclease
MGAAKTLLSAEEFDNYPFEEDKRYELDEGELIEMTRPVYRHNRVLIRLTVKVYNYFEATGSGEVLNSENLFALSPSIRRAPDLAIFLGDRSTELKDTKVIAIIPDIVAEVLSPSETPRMINRKLKQYFAAGLKEVWLIHPEAREIEICTGAGVPDTLADGDILTSSLLPGFELSLQEQFA